MISCVCLRYPSFAKARIVVDKRSGKTKYGFVSFLEASDMVRALREMQGTARLACNEGHQV